MGRPKGSRNDYSIRLTGTCAECGKPIEYWPSRPHKFCSRRCYGAAKSRCIGPLAPRWAGGEQPGCPYRSVTHNGRRIGEHRYVMSQHLGRELLRSEWVHHVNENKKDNRLENLELITPRQHHQPGYHPHPHKPLKPCTICGREEHLVKGRCKRCRGYFYNHGTERPPQSGYLRGFHWVHRKRFPK